MYTLMLAEHGFWNYAPFKWNKKQTGMKLDSYTSLGDCEALYPDVFYDYNSFFCVCFFLFL